MGKRSTAAAPSSAVDDVDMASPRKSMRTEACAQAWTMATRGLAQDGIVLTPAEERLFAFLQDIEKHYQCHAVLRVAGGWVRDKVFPY